MQDTTKKGRVYLSGPITGTNDYMEKFAQAEAALTAAGYAVINPARICQPLMDAAFTWQEYLDLDLYLLSRCTKICMLPGWEKSRGARMELAYAAEHGIAAMHLDMAKIQ